MNVLITGAAGWLARHVVEVLQQKHQLRLLDRVDPNEATIFVPFTPERVAAPLKTDWPYLRAEIDDEPAMLKACEGIDAIIHLAAATTGLPEHGKAIMHANVTGTYVVLDAARKSGTKRVLAASSINTFGTFYWRISGKPVVHERLPLDESAEPVPEDPYSLSKFCNEHTLAAFSRAYDLTTAAFRFAGVWPDEMVQTTRAKREPTQEWSHDLFQWVHVNDIAEGIAKALECETLPSHGVYTLAAPDTRCPEPTMELIERLRPDLKSRLVAPLPGRSPLVSIERARNAFGYAPSRRMFE
jgi:UDP-glucose 4-epimerase